jgi:hypothetical protein
MKVIVKSLRNALIQFWLKLRISISPRKICPVRKLILDVSCKCLEGFRLEERTQNFGLLRQDEGRGLVFPLHR